MVAFQRSSQPLIVLTSSSARLANETAPVCGSMTGANLGGAACPPIQTALWRVPSAML
jgi:hypothetical protein